MVNRKILSFTKKVLEHQYLPAVLAFFAFVLMLPALDDGLMIDDLVQRPILLEQSELPAMLYETGHVPNNPGTLSAAVFDLFGFNRSREKIKQLMDYGLLPWWSYENLRVSLWRPLAAFTHWLDYRLFPKVPMLMHAHSILWFSAVVFIVSILYRRLMSAGWVAGFAAVLFLLDENSYFPVMFIANRGYIISIFFGVLSILCHHRWRTTNSLTAAVSAQILLLLSLLSNEAGVTTFAYLLAYELVLDRANWLRRALSLAPAVLVIILWRLVYNSLGYGIYGSGLYLDPLNEPVTYVLTFLKRAPLLLMGQLTWQSPEFLLGSSESFRTQVLILSVIFLLIIFILLLPLLRKNSLARFWFAAMMFSVIPIATVSPLSKNLPFVAIGAFGLIAVFIAELFNGKSYLPRVRIWRTPARALCVLFIIVHIPMAAAGRMIAPKMQSFFTGSLDFGSGDISNKDIVVINGPSPLSLIFVPFVNAYHGKPIPKSLRTLAPGFRAMACTRLDENTLTLKAHGGDFLSCDQKSPLHLIHLYKSFDMFREKHFQFEVGDKIILSHLTVEIVDIDKKGQPTEVSFKFDVPLEDPNLSLLQFNWADGSYSRLELPAVGESSEIAGPPQASFTAAVRYLMVTLCNR